MAKLKLKEENLRIIVSAEDEDIPIDSDQLPSYTEAELEALREEANQNLWKWCSVSVKAVYRIGESQIESDPDYLGCCSYESEEDFVKTSGYYQDMVATVRADIEGQLLLILEEIKELEEPEDPEWDGDGVRLSKREIMAMPENAIKTLLHNMGYAGVDELDDETATEKLLAYYSYTYED